MNCLIRDDQLLKKIEIWNKISKKKDLILNPSTINLSLKTKIILYGQEATDFRNRKIPEIDSNYIYLLAILMDSVF